MIINRVDLGGRIHQLNNRGRMVNETVGVFLTVEDILKISVLDNLSSIILRLFEVGNLLCVFKENSFSDRILRGIWEVINVGMVEEQR